MPHSTKSRENPNPIAILPFSDWGCGVILTGAEGKDHYDAD